jgi:hypothetical protein
LRHCGFIRTFGTKLGAYRFSVQKFQPHPDHPFLLVCFKSQFWQDSRSPLPRGIF